MPFAVIRVSDSHELHRYDTGQEAGNAASCMNRVNATDGVAERYRVQKIEAPEPPNTDWHEREHDRFVSGEYQTVPWHECTWARDLAAPYSFGGKLNHFPHVAKGDPTQIAFTESNDAGTRDVQKRMRPGRYLERFFGEDLTASDIRTWAADWAAMYEENDLQIATTPEEIARVYGEGPSSCMSGRAREFDTPVHPASVYGAGDLAVAYMVRDNEITSRALLWPAKKQVGRIYGDVDRIYPLLKAAGYGPNINTSQSAGCGPWGNFEGARLLRVECDDGRFVCPWLDDNCFVNDDGRHLIITNDGDYDGQNTDGMCGECGFVCDSCNDRYSEDERNYVDGHGELCDSCYCDSTFHCDECSSRVYGEPAFHVGNHTVCDGCSENYSLCEGCNEHCHGDDMATVELENGRYCEECRRDMEETPCGELTTDDPETACGCVVCEEKRTGELQLEAGEADNTPFERLFPVRLSPTSPTVLDDGDQFELTLGEPSVPLRAAYHARRELRSRRGSGFFSGYREHVLLRVADDDRAYLVSPYQPEPDYPALAA